MRTHYCADLNENNIGEKVKLVGWVNSYRDHGGVIFIDLRDKTGIIQLVADPAESPSAHKIADMVRDEYVISIEGIIRDSIGKKATKALRRDGYLIANIYGRGLENVSCAFNRNDFIRAMKKKENLAFDVKVGDKELKVVVQEYQKDPITSQLIHVDMMVAQPGVVTHFMVPVEPVGEAIGLKNKGLVNIAKRRLRVKAKIEDLPKAIVIDVTEMDLGDSKLIRDIEAPAGVTFTDADRVSVLSIIKAK